VGGVFRSCRLVVGISAGIEYGYWIPDFILKGSEGGIPVEVKPIEWANDETQWDNQVLQCDELQKVLASGCSEVLVLGARPVSWFGGMSDFVLGMLAHCCKDDPFPADEPDETWAPWRDTALLWGGYPPYKFDFSAFYGSFHYRMGGQADGDHQLKLISGDVVDRIWREAGNLTQWRPVKSPIPAWSYPPRSISSTAACAS
jgi:hypothetical protein